MDTDGAVRVMVGGRDYGESQFNRATDALRQPGSSFKPFVYAHGDDERLHAGKRRSRCPDLHRQLVPAGTIPAAIPGAITLTTALVKSINIIPVRLAQAIGARQDRRSRARAMGITDRTPHHPLAAARRLGGHRPRPWPRAYSVFANGGYKATPYAFTQIMTSSGEILYDRRKDAPPPERVLDDTTVAAMNAILSQVPEWGTGRRAKLEGIRTAGKTGTTSAYRDAWFVGFTGNYTAAVWMGNDGYAPTRRLTGGILPAMMWHDLMTFAHTGIDIKPIPFVEPEPPAETEAEVVAEAPCGRGTGADRRASVDGAFGAHHHAASADREAAPFIATTAADGRSRSAIAGRDRRHTGGSRRVNRNTGPVAAGLASGGRPA